MMSADLVSPNHFTVLSNTVAEVSERLDKLQSGLTRLTKGGVAKELRFDRLEYKFDSLQPKLDSLIKHLTPTNSDAVNIGSQRQSTPITSSQWNHVSLNSDPDVNVMEPENVSPILVNRRDLVRRVEMPIFEGINAYGWIARVERFFRLNDYTEAEKLDLVSLSLDGDVLSWYNWQMNRVPFTDWKAFKYKLLARFKALKSHSPSQRLLSNKQVLWLHMYTILKICRLKLQV